MKTSRTAPTSLLSPAAAPHLARVALGTLPLHQSRNAMSTDCCPAGQGWFSNAESGAIERCDTCRQFPHDDAAADFARITVTECQDCNEAFADTGKGQRSLLNPSLCEACLCAD